MRTVALPLAVWTGCADAPGPGPACETLAATPADDPADWGAAGGGVPSIGPPRWVVPSAAIPAGLAQASNNNVSLLVTAGAWFLAWRTAPTHFASPETEMHVISSTDHGASWVHEHTIALGTDVREPSLFLSGAEGGRVVLTWFQGGTDAAAFQPGAVWRAERCGRGDWSDARIEEDTTRVPWDVKWRGGELLRTSYTGDHYQRDAVIDVHLERSPDAGITWEPVGREVVYEGGNSEAAFEILADGSLVSVTRNEDGDETGRGAMVCRAPAEDPSAWDCPELSDPQRYDSPELLRAGEDLWLLARRDPDGVFGNEDSLLPYSTRRKRSSLYRVDPATRAVSFVVDLPGAGDTAFPQARRTGPRSFLVANYTSPLDDPDVSWLEGQTSDRGSAIYLVDLTFDLP